MSNILDRISFLSLFLVVVLLPVFFLPYTNIPIETSKGLLLVVGLVISVIFWAMARFSDGKIVVAKSLCLLSGLGIILAFLLSSIFSSAPQMSFFGIMFDIGSFWFILTVFLLMLMSSILFKDPKKAAPVLLGVILSSAFVFVFQCIRLFFPQYLLFGFFSSAIKVGNVLGSWNALGIFAGFFAFISLFLIEFFSVSKRSKILLSILMVISLFMAAAVGFSLSWGILGVFSLIIFVYKISFSFGEKKEQGNNENNENGVHFPFVSFILMMLSLLFFFTPQITGFLPNHLKLSDLEVVPSFSSTMSVAKSTILKNPLLGIGPNRFGDAWALYKPSEVNASIFWNTPFDTGSGLLPTFAATTGILGILSLLVFFYFFLLTGVKSVFSNIKNGMNQIMSVFFIASLYLFVASLFYTTGVVVFTLAFVFAGIFIGLLSNNHPEKEISILFFNNPKKSFFTLLSLIFMMVVFCITGFKYLERFASVPYYNQALNAKTIEIAESAIVKANQFYQNDQYLRTSAQIYLLKLNSLISKSTPLSEAEKATLQPLLSQAISDTKTATFFDKDNYQNFFTLGSIYSTVAQYGVKDGYTQALDAYNQASSLNPTNPGIKLAMGNISFANNQIKNAKDYANSALTLKPDYVDALIFLSQIAKNENDNTSALYYAQTALTYVQKALASSSNDNNLMQTLTQTSNSLTQYISSLKKSGSVSSSTNSPTTSKKTQ